MLQKMKRSLKPTTLLLVGGFSVSLTAILIGISAINSVISSLLEMDSETPIYLTMQNTGFSLAIAIYFFSIANCLVITNYWMITEKRNLAIRKAFGWSYFHLIGLVTSRMVKMLFISLVISGILLCILATQNAALFSVEITPFFVLSSVTLMLFTLFMSVLIPIIRIIKIHPVEVIS